MPRIRSTKEKLLAYRKGVQNNKKLTAEEKEFLIAECDKHLKKLAKP